MKATELEIQHLEGLYEGRKPFFGDLHNHAQTSDRSDGLRPLSHWKGALEALKVDFVAILDHGQVEHMYKPEWEDGLFVGGTEPGTTILDSKAEDRRIHYNLIFENAKPLEELLEEFYEFKFTGGIHGRFQYPGFTTARFQRLVDFVMDHNGFFVHPHPKQVMKSDDPLDYLFRERTGLEVFYGDYRNDLTADNYKLWLDLLALDKIVYATGGNDSHACASDKALTCIYAEERTNAAFISHLRKGDMVCGSVGVRMCIGDTRTGGECSFAGQRLTLAVSDFHCSVKNPDHKYRVDLFDDKGLVFSESISCDKAAYFSIDADENAKFYRAEVVDVNNGYRLALGNPIWNR